jgi:hypothetical protein
MKKCINLKPHEAAALARGETITIWRPCKPQPDAHMVRNDVLYRHPKKLGAHIGDLERHPSPFPLNVPLLGNEAFDGCGTDKIRYKADGGPAYNDNGRGVNSWKPSIHMPPWAVRTLVTLSDVRVRKIQDASLEECLSSGVTQGEKRTGLPIFYYPGGDTDHIKALMNLVGAKRSNLYHWSYTATPSKNLS